MGGVLYSRTRFHCTRAGGSVVNGGLYLRGPPLDAVDDLIASAGAVLPISLSPVTGRGLCSCFA